MNTITKEQMAALLNGREYGDEITRAEHQIARASGLVVVFGYSDDNMEVRGAWGDDEFGANDGGEWEVSPLGVLKSWDDIDHDAEDECAEYFRRKGTGHATLRAIWSPKEPECSWAYELDAPHATFDVMEDGQLYCRGIVFAVADLPTKPAIPTEASERAGKPVKARVLWDSHMEDPRRLSLNKRRGMSCDRQRVLVLPADAASVEKMRGQVTGALEPYAKFPEVAAQAVLAALGINP